MKWPLMTKLVLGAVSVLAALVMVLEVTTPRRVQAKDDNDEGSLVRIGFEIAPVPLKLEGKNRALVGLGSFLVNAQSDCNGCHTAGGPPNFNYANGGNPYFGQKTKTDPTTYLAGGTDFGPAVPSSAAVGGFPPGSQPPSYPPPEFGNYVGPDMIARNLTPDKTGRAEGGNTLEQFKQIMRKGTDFDKLHPTCTAATPAPAPANCIPAPVDGSLLQVMPWPVFHNMTDRQIEAIYEYLSAIPCIAGPSQPSDLPPPLQYAFPVLHNDCGNAEAVLSGTYAPARAAQTDTRISSRR